MEQFTLTSPLALALIIITNLLLYIRTVNYGYIVDDINRIKAVTNRDWFSRWDWVGITQRLYGVGMFKDKRVDRTFTILLHTTASSLIYFVFGANWVSFLAALLYSIAPTNNQTAIWFNGRRYIVNTILCLIIYATLPWGLVLYPLVPFFQINGVPVAMMVVTTPYWWLAFAILTAPLWHKQRLIKWMKSRIHFRMKCSQYFYFGWEKIILMIKTLGYYFFHILFPWKVVFYSDFQQNFAITKNGNKEAYAFNWQFAKGVLALVLLLLGFVFFPNARVGILWFTFFIGPFLNFVTITQMVADRYTTIASIGLFVALTNIAPWAVPFLVGWYLAKNVEAQKMYVDLDNFYLYHIWHTPETVLSTLFYVRDCNNAKMYYHSFVAVLRCLRFNPDDLRGLLVKARVLNLMGARDECKKCIDRCWEVMPDNLYKSQEELKNDLLSIQNFIYKEVPEASVYNEAYSSSGANILAKLDTNEKATKLSKEEVTALRDFVSKQTNSSSDANMVNKIDEYLRANPPRKVDKPMGTKMTHTPPLEDCYE